MINLNGRLACSFFMALWALPVTANDTGMKHVASGSAHKAQLQQVDGKKDERKVLALSTEERAFVLEEMRGLLSGTRMVIDGLVNEDMKAVASAARSAGMGVMHNMPASFKTKLPMEFKQLGMSMHAGFDQIAMDADGMADPKLTLRQMNTILQTCVACHGSYQIKVEAKSK